MPLDRLIVGAISLNTTCHVVEDNDGTVPLPSSVLAIARQVGELGEVAARLQAAAINVLRPTP